jgi:O-antigen/teichoic acid export membrane protein
MSRPPLQPAAATAPAPAAASPATERATFFRQGGWMMLATVAGGVLMWAVHLLSRAIPASEYGTLITLLSVVNLIPTLPLQMVFTQQTALALATGRAAQLAGLIRYAGLGILLTGVLGAVVLGNFHQFIITRWNLANPLALPVLLLVILLSLVWPVFAGLMQGRQNFLWLGWCSILNGAGRIIAATLIVMVGHGHATGILAGVAAGLVLACMIGAWQAHAAWRAAPGAPGEFDTRILTRQVAPLMLGFVATQFLFSADTAYVNAYFGADRTAPYGAAGTLSRALLWLVLPLAGVMFPKIVRHSVSHQKAGLLGVALLVTGALATLGFLSLWVLGPWLVRIFPPAYAPETLQVLPWYAGAMVPLALANVLVNDLLARSQFKIVPALVLLATAYGVALTQFHTSPTMILQLLCGFNLLLLAVCAGFVWGGKK